MVAQMESFETSPKLSLIDLHDSFLNNNPNELPDIDDTFIRQAILDNESLLTAKYVFNKKGWLLTPRDKKKTTPEVGGKPLD